MKTPNFDQIFEQNMKQWQANVDEMKRAGETWTQFWTEQTRANLELMTAWQQQSTELFSSFAARATELSGKERERVEAMSREWQSQWQTGVEQSTELAREFGQAAEEMMAKGQAQMAEMGEMVGRATGMAGKPAAKSTSKKN